MKLWHFLLRGSDDLVLPRSWFTSLAYCEARWYTVQQLYGGSVVKDTAQTQREAFWEMIAEKKAKKALPKNVERISERMSQR